MFELVESSMGFRPDPVWGQGELASPVLWGLALPGAANPSDRSVTPQ